MKYSLLIIDDDEAMLMVLKRILEKKYFVYTASDGVEALNFLSQGIRPDAIVSDLHMHNINGYDLVRHLSTSKIYNEIPIIIISGSFEPDIALLKKHPYVQILSKPFDPVNLYHVVHETLQKHNKKNMQVVK